MKYAKQITALVVVVSLCVWCGGKEALVSTNIHDSTPVFLAQQATGLPFEPKVEKISGGQIDWTRGVVCAVGLGKAPAYFAGRQAELMARRAAYVVSARNAALVLTGIRVGPGGRFKNIRDGRIRADVRLSGFRELDATYDPKTRTATARLEIPLCGVRGVVNVLGLKGNKPKRRWTWPKISGEGKPYDVIVIDARGLHCKPAVLPRITTTDGQCVFDGAERLADSSPIRTVVQYATLSKDKKIPRQAKRRQRRCLTVKAFRIQTDGSIVLNPMNLDLLTCAPGVQLVLHRGNLLIVTDK